MEGSGRSGVCPEAPDTAKAGKTWFPWTVPLHIFYIYKNDPRPENVTSPSDHYGQTCEMLIIMRMWHVEFVMRGQRRSRSDTRKAHQKLSSECMAEVICTGVG